MFSILKHGPQSSKALPLALTLIAVSLSSGCLNTQQGLRSRKGDKRIVEPFDYDKALNPPSWRRVAVGFKPKVEHVGYVRTITEGKGEELTKIRWVYTLEFDKRGFFTDSGRTYRKQRNGDYKHIGTFDANTCVSRLLGRDGPISYYSMPPPEGSNRPYYDELNAPETKIKKKEEKDES